MSSEYSNPYRLEPLKATNWLPWKQHFLAILRDLGLEKCDLSSEEKAEREKWLANDAKARTRLELSVGDSEMIHLSGASTARQMWKQLTQVKESKGRLGILA
ncbi:hypothetical protein FA15DRAFT_628907, partial [Coprinopsis marcescibilis]